MATHGRLRETMVPGARWSRRITALGATLLLLGCGAAEDEPQPEQDSTEETMNQDEAAERVQEHIDDAVAVLPEGIEPEALGEPAFAACDDPTDGGSGDRITVSHSYLLNELPVEDNETTAETLQQYWTDNGYEVLDDERPERPSITVQHEEDGFRVYLRVSVHGDLSLGSSSPCVWPDGQP